MKKVLKYSLITLLSLVVLLAIGLMAIVNFINPNDYRDKISALASNAINQPVHINGDINWQFLPTFGVVVHDITVGNRSNESQIYASLDTAKIGVHLWPLLSQHLSIKELRLDGLTVEKTIATGATNQATSDVAVSLAPAAAANNIFASLSRLDLQQLNINHARILLHNRLTNIDSSVSDLQLKASHLSIDSITPFTLAFTYQADLQKVPTLDVKWQGTIKTDSQRQQIACDDCHLDLTDTLVSREKIALTANMDLSYNLGQQSFEASHIQGAIDDLTYSAQVQATSLDQNPDVQFSLDSHTEQLGKILTKAGITLPNPKALQRLDLSTQGSLHNKQLNLTRIQVQLNDSHINGSLQTTALSNSSFNTAIHIDHIDLATYLKPSSPSIPLKLINVDTHLKILLPTDQQSLAINGPISFEDSDLKGLVIKQFSTLVDLKDQRVQLTASKASLLGGSYQGNSQVDYSLGGLKFTTSPTFSHIQIQPLLALIDQKVPLSGQGDLSGTLSSQGLDAASIKQALNGHIKMAIHDGTLRGIDLTAWINKAVALKNQSPMPAATGDGNTHFGDMSATANILNGVISNEDLLLKAPFARVKGHGTIDLNRQQLNYHLNIDQMSQLSRVTRLSIVPLIITGSFDQPNIQIDMTQLGQQIVDQQLKKHQGRLAEILAERTGNAQLGQAVGSIIKNIQLDRLTANG